MVRPSAPIGGVVLGKSKEARQQRVKGRYSRQSPAAVTIQASLQVGDLRPGHVMATVPVRFEFYCDGGENTLRFVHDIPQEVVGSSQLVGEHGAYDDAFMKAVTPILKARAQACQDASGASCESCGSRATDIYNTFCHG